MQSDIGGHTKMRFYGALMARWPIGWRTRTGRGGGEQRTRNTRVRRYVLRPSKVVDRRGHRSSARGAAINPTTKSRNYTRNLVHGSGEEIYRNTADIIYS